jgi:hypothetical protein
MRTVLAIFAVVSVTMSSFRHTLAGTSIALRRGLTPLGVIELAFAYELAPAARMIARAGWRNLTLLATVCIGVAALGPIAHGEAGFGGAPVLLALIGVACGLMQPYPHGPVCTLCRDRIKSPSFRRSSVSDKRGVPSALY